MKLYKHQEEALEKLSGKNKVALYWDMGLGKTYGGSEKMIQLGAKINLVICQKSKIDDWVNHFTENYEESENMMIYDLTEWKKDDWAKFKTDLKFKTDWHNASKYVLIINYDLVWRRKELLLLKDFTLLLDESSMLQHETSKRSEFILKMQPANVILLSGTPIGGKYENLWSQIHLLGWDIPKKMFYNHYVNYHWDDSNGFPLMIIDGYKNEERLKRKLREYGCDFLKTEEVLDLPDQIHQTINVPISKEYKTFKNKKIIKIDDLELVGDTTLKKMLYERQLCGQYNLDKLNAFVDILTSTNDRLIVFYNFNAELELLQAITNNYLQRSSCVINGQYKSLYDYEHISDSVTFIQYQAGAMGLNLQKANKIIYFTPPLSSELFEQSKKRIHRIGQKNTCFYYYLTCKNSIEEKIYKTLAERKDYTDALFEEDDV